MSNGQDPGEEHGQGVQELIRRLQEEGTEAGRQEAQRVLDEAHAEARRLVDEARQEAERVRAEAREAAEQERKAGREALQQVYRDTLLCVKESLDGEFRRHLSGLVAHELSEPETLRRMIIAVAGDAVPEQYRDQAMTVHLPKQALSLEELRQAPAHGDDALAGLARDLAAGMLGEGVLLEEACGDCIGMRIRFEGEDVCVELTDEAIAEVLYRHLIPRFRAIVDGIIR